jgi:hypothetical protein
MLSLGSGVGLGRRERQGNPEGGASVGGGVDADCAAKSFDDHAGQVEANPKTLRPLLTGPAAPL